ncbi:MAG TPA: gamma-glutamylcyclotransferase [Polyangiaceae bacterium LLY-WYZ-15_(1-7)]|nr:gamma-glutamylcyclotransferase [Polyangiaceae bacterium LLY-WYZ-15_(1-7)]
MPHYFAYGSNLDVADLETWAAERGFPSPAPRVIDRAFWPDHALLFDYHSNTRGGGALNVAPSRGHCVPGVLFEVADLAALDAKEGVDVGRYERVACTCLLPDGRVFPDALSYRVTPAWRAGRHVPPTPSYEAIVRRGLEAHAVPARPFEHAVANLDVPPFPDAVFVYGTLKRGHCRAGTLERAEPLEVSAGRVAGELVDLGAYPGLTLGAGWVRGELWRFRRLNALLEELDAIEDFEGWDALERSMYRRVVLPVERDDGRRELAWTYLYQGERERDAPRIADGSWRGA